MKNLLTLIVFCPILLFGQVQIGLDIDGEFAGDNSSNVSLSSDGSIVAIGAPANDGNGNSSGHVRIFQNTNNAWTQIGNDIDGEAAGDGSGSVSLSADGSIVAIGAPGNDGNGIDSGHVRIFQNINGIWTQIGSDINGEAAGDSSGGRVSLSADGSTVAIGASGNDGNGLDSGHVRIFKNISGVWTQIGSDINGEAAGDRLCSSLSLSSDGSIVAMGSTLNTANTTNPTSPVGHVRVFKNINNVWTQIGSDLDGNTSLLNFGLRISLSSDGTIIAITSMNLGNLLPGTGSVLIYKNIGNVWTQLGNTIHGDNPNDQFGSSISLSSNGSTIAIGAVGNDNNNTYIGYTRLYKNLNNAWTSIGSDIDGEAISDFSGSHVKLSSNGEIVAIGAFGNDGNGLDSGHVRIYDLSAITLSNTSFKLNTFSIYSNPTKDKVRISLNSGQVLKQINLYDALGKYLYSEQRLEINTNHLTRNIYIIEVETNLGKSAKKIVVK